MRIKWLTSLLLILLAAGTWQFGNGVWIHAKAQLARHLISQAWERTLVRQAPVRPWPWADTWPVARLRWQDRVDLYVLAGINGASLPFGPGMAAPGAHPDGGVLIAGHRDTHFAFLRHIRPGDRLTFTDMQGRPRVYQVASREVVDSRSASLDPGAMTAGLVLVTCYPFDALRAGGPLRLVVRTVREGVVL